MPQDEHAYKQCDVMAFKHSAQVRTPVECHNALTQGTLCTVRFCVYSQTFACNHRMCAAQNVHVYTHTRAM